MASSDRWSVSVVIIGGRLPSWCRASRAARLVLEVSGWFFGRLMVVVRAARWCLMAVMVEMVAAGGSWRPEVVLGGFWCYWDYRSYVEPFWSQVAPPSVPGSVVGASGWLVEMSDGLRFFFYNCFLTILAID
ncbi:hypothetical protein Dimus_010567 [Dionaea muscipula]